MANTNRPSKVARNASVMAGIDKHITGNVTIGGVPYTPATLKAVFSDESTAINTTEALHQQVADQVQVTKAATSKADGVYGLLRSYLIGQYGKQANAVLGDFGMKSPKTKGPQTLESKTAAAAKRKATRQVRNTLGSTQKKKLKGTIEVPVQAVTTITPVLPSAGTGSTGTAPALPAAGSTPSAATPATVNGSSAVPTAAKPGS